MKTCQVPGCERAFLAKGYCSAHYANWRNHGVPIAPNSTPRGLAKRWLEQHVTHSSDDCLLWPFGVSRDGYGVFYADGRSTMAHRQMCILTHGASSGRAFQAAHDCGNPLCVNPRHLQWKTPKANAADRARHGTEIRGAARHNAKLTQEHADEARRMVASGLFLKKEVAAHFGISTAALWSLLKNRTWIGVERGASEAA